MGSSDTSSLSFGGSGIKARRNGWVSAVLFLAEVDNASHRCSVSLPLHQQFRVCLTLRLCKLVFFSCLIMQRSLCWHKFKVIHSQPCFLLSAWERWQGCCSLINDSHLLQLLRTALFGSSASSFLPFLKGAWSVRWGEILKFYVPVHFSEVPAWSIDKHKPQSHDSSIPSGTSYEGRRGDSYLQVSLYLSNFLDVSSGHELTQVNIRAAVQILWRWTRVCRSLCRPCPTCPQPTVSLPCQSHSSVVVCLGAAPVHPHPGQAGHPLLYWHTLTASPSCASGTSCFQGEQTEEKPLWEDGARDAIHLSEKITMLQWHSLFVAASYQPLLWSEAWPCS